MHGLEEEYGDRIAFTYLDIDDPATAEFKQALGYRAQPQLFLLDANGNIVRQWFGLVSREELVAAFEEVMD